MSRLRPWPFYLLVFFCGMVLVTAFAPLRWYGLAIPCLVVLLFAWQAQKRSAALAGLAFGSGQFMAGVSWVYVSLERFGGMAPALAVFAVVIFVSYLAFFPALAGYGFQYFHRRFNFNRSTMAMVFFPVLWVIQETMRSWLLGGFPWLIIGYSQTESWLAAYTAILGVYGLSWLCALSAALIWLIMSANIRQKLLAVALLACIWSTAWMLQQKQWVQVQGEPIRIALVQGNIALAEKWNPENLEQILDRYLAASESLPDPDLVVWPEASIPTYRDILPPEFLRRIRDHSAAFLFGLIERQVVSTAAGTATHFYNGVQFINGEYEAMYRKRHLVPFGEFLPLQPVFNWLLDYLNIPMSDFSSWQGEQAVMQVNDSRLGISICYEDAFQRDILPSLPHSNLLVNVSEDAWFGDSLAPHQRIQMAQIRAQETGRPMIRAANTGVSAIIDSRGHITAGTEQFIATVLQGKVQPMTGSTPFVRYGNFLLLVLALTVYGVWALFMWWPRFTTGTPLPGRESQGNQ